MKTQRHSTFSAPSLRKSEERKEIPYENTALAFRDSQDTLGTLFRYEAASRNGSDRTLHQLLFLQDRRARESDEGQIVDVLPSKADASDAA
jgi:hypothetical protein